MENEDIVKVRCRECGHIIAHITKPIESGEISIMCNARKSNGKRCKTINIIKPIITPKN